MEDRERSSEDDPTALMPPPPTLSLAALREMMEQRARAGWVWDEAAHILAHPQDHQLHFHIDPQTYRLSLSAKLAARLNDPPARPSEEPRP